MDSDSSDSPRDFREEEEVEEEDAVLTSKESLKYANYRPAFVQIGYPHPHQLCEGSILSSVLPPPVTYHLKLESKYYNKPKGAHLSNSQLEAIIYACQSHEKFFETLDNQSNKTLQVRQGFFLGDGTGTGKSRILAGIIYESRLSGVNQVLFVSASKDLLDNANNEINHFLPNQTVTYLSGSRDSFNAKESILMVTYNTLSDAAKQKRVEKWMGENYNGLIIFDEAHNAKGAYDHKKPSATGQMVDKLQGKNPMARVVYSSATGASEPLHLLYMSRLGIFGPNRAYKNGVEFCGAIDRLGVVALELLAVELKSKGVFLSRMVSLENIEVFVNEVKPRESFQHVYQRCSQLWLLLMRYIEMKKEAIKSSALDDPTTAKQVLKEFNRSLGTFHAGAQKFFSALILSSKVSQAAKLSSTSLDNDKSVIIGIQSTGQARFQAFDREEWNKKRPYSSAAETLRMNLELLGISVGCPKVYLKDESIVNIGDWSEQDELEYNEAHVNTNFDEYYLPASFGIRPSKRAKVQVSELKLWPVHSVGYYWLEVKKPNMMTWSFDEVAQEITPEGLARLYHELAPLLPINALDELHQRIGHQNIAELTGRNYQYVFISDEKGWNKIARPKTPHLIDRFQGGELRVSILSSAGSTGHSLHADKGCVNQQPRVHITLQYAWSPDQLLQQIGRSHRSNQAHVPTYHIIKSPIPGEVRFVAIVGKRLDQLGAICKGQAKASPLDECLFDGICSDAGVEAFNKAVNELSKDCSVGQMLNLVQIETIGTTRSYYSKTKDDGICKGFNRSLYLPLEIQSQFMTCVYQGLAKTKVASYSPLIEIPDQNTTVKLQSFEKVKVSKDSCLEVYQFEISRVADFDFIRRVIKQAGPTCQMYLKGVHPLLTVEMDNGHVMGYFPYSKYPVKQVENHLDGWKLAENEEQFLHYWKYWVNKLVAFPGCFHRAQGTPCKDRCLHKWGVATIVIVGGSTSKFLYELPPHLHAKLRLAKVSFTQNNASKKCIGILLDFKKQTETLSFIEGKFKTICENVQDSSGETSSEDEQESSGQTSSDEESEGKSTSEAEQESSGQTSSAEESEGESDEQAPNAESTSKDKDESGYEENDESDSDESPEEIDE